MEGNDSTPVTRPVGRPTLYNAELANTICQRLMDGQSLREIDRDPSMPCAVTILRWAAKHEEFGKQYALAVTYRADLAFEDIQEVADDGRNDWIARNDPQNAGYVANGEHINRSRLRVDTMKWRIARMNPRKYGDRLQTVATDPDGNPPVSIQITTTDPIEAARAYAELIKGG